MSVGGVCVALSRWGAVARGSLACGSVVGEAVSAAVCRQSSEGRPQALTPTACVCACRLDNNSIGDAGATKLGEALQQNSTLRTLS